MAPNRIQFKDNESANRTRLPIEVTTQNSIKNLKIHMQTMQRRRENNVPRCFRGGCNETLDTNIVSEINLLVVLIVDLSAKCFCRFLRLLVPYD